MSKKRSFQTVVESDPSDCDRDECEEPSEKKRRLNDSPENTMESDDDDMAGVFEFVSSLHVLKYSTEKLKQIQTQYTEQKDTVAPISCADPLTNDDYDANNQLINKHKLWTHSMPIDIFKTMLGYCIRPNYDITVLTLVKVCKSWRDIVINLEFSDKDLFNRLWTPCIEYRNIKKKFCWQDLVATPKKYLALIYNLNTFDMEEMSNEENIKYRELCAKSNGCDALDTDILMPDTNIPLLIQVLQHCPRLYSMELTGQVSKDIFVTMTDHAAGLYHLSLSYCQCPDFMWYLEVLGEQHLNENALPNLKSIEIERGHIDFDLEVFSQYFTDIEVIALHKQYVNGDVLCELFNNCVKLRSFYLFKYGSEDGDWFGAFKRLCEKNKVIESIEMNGAPGFDDECCELLLDKEVCPKLNHLCLVNTVCSQEMIDKLKEARPDIDIVIT
eukprot:225122_1